MQKEKKKLLSPSLLGLSPWDTGSGGAQEAGWEAQPSPHPCASHTTACFGAVRRRGHHDFGNLTAASSLMRTLHRVPRRQRARAFPGADPTTLQAEPRAWVPLLPPATRMDTVLQGLSPDKRHRSECGCRKAARAGWGEGESPKQGRPRSPGKSLWRRMSRPGGPEATSLGTRLREGEAVRTLGRVGSSSKG